MAIKITKAGTSGKKFTGSETLPQATLDRFVDLEAMAARYGFARTGKIIEEAPDEKLAQAFREWDRTTSRANKNRWAGFLARAGYFQPPTNPETKMAEDHEIRKNGCIAYGPGFPDLTCGRDITKNQRCEGHQSWTTEKPEKITKTKQQPPEKKVGGKVPKAKVNPTKKKERTMTTKNETTETTPAPETKKAGKKVKATKKAAKAEGKKLVKAAKKEGKKGERGTKKDKQLPMRTLFRKLTHEAHDKKGGKLGSRKDLVARFVKEYPNYGADFAVSSYITWAKAGTIPDCYTLIEDEEGNLKTGKLVPSGKGKKAKKSE